MNISRGSVYYLPRPVSAADLVLMRVIDELHLEHRFAGSRMLRDMLQARGFELGRKHVDTLMRRMGIEALHVLVFAVDPLGIVLRRLQSGDPGRPHGGEGWSDIIARFSQPHQPPG